MSLAADVLTLAEAVNNVDKLAISGDVDKDLTSLAMLDECIGSLQAARKRLSDCVGREMGERHHVVPGIGPFMRQPRREGGTKCKDEEGLWRYVIDTRIVDPETGEVLPTHEVIRMVYGAESKETGRVRLTGASPTKVEAIGVDPDDFFEKGDIVKDGWTVRRRQ